MDAYRVAFNTWQEKTEWVQKDKRFDVLLPWGKHRADVLKEYIDYLEAKCAALAAELSAVEEIHNEAVFITDEHYEQCPPEVQKMIRSLAVMQIPAYKSFLAEVRAHDLNAFIRHHSAELDARIKNGGEQFDEKSVRIRDIIVSARLFREQIRNEAAQ